MFDNRVKVYTYEYVILYAWPALRAERARKLREQTSFRILRTSPCYVSNFYVGTRSLCLILF